MIAKKLLAAAVFAVQTWDPACIRAYLLKILQALLSRCESHKDLQNCLPPDPFMIMLILSCISLVFPFCLRTSLAERGAPGPTRNTREDELEAIIQKLTRENAQLREELNQRPMQDTHSDDSEVVDKEVIDQLLREILHSCEELPVFPSAPSHQQQEADKVVNEESAVSDNGSVLSDESKIHNSLNSCDVPIPSRSSIKAANTRSPLVASHIDHSPSALSSLADSPS